MKIGNSGTQSAMDRGKSLERTIVIAVDFGTTFSGLAWAQTGKPEVQTPIIMWPNAMARGLEGITSDKVPTEIFYDQEDFAWGFQIPDSRPRHTWFKLDLDPRQDRGTSLIRQYPNPLAAPPAYNISAEKLATDYLTALRKHAEQILRCKIPESALKEVNIQYIITVPAVWSDQAQAKTRKCAEKAGMGDAASLQMISEPEAAAIYALDTLTSLQIELNDTFVLCDAGGGTVDLISYTVVQLKPNLKLVEASPGTGSCCGSTILNRRFQEFLEDKLSGEENFDSEVVEDAMSYFENVVKRNFMGTFGEGFQVPVPGLSNAALGIKRNKLSVTGTEIRQIFEPVLNEVAKLVIEQMKATKMPVAAVLLVGGFGQSAYVREEILKEVMIISKATKVIQPANGWTAVVRGALMKGLASTSPAFATVNITERSPRKHYGVRVSHKWEPEMGDIHRRQFDNFYGHHRILLFECFVSKGSKIKEEEPLRLKYARHLLVSLGAVGNFSVSIKFCSDPSNQGAPRYPNGDVKDLVEVTADLSQLPLSSLPIKVGADGQQYYEICFEIEVTFYSAHTTYELIYNEINYGAISAEYV